MYLDAFSFSMNLNRYPLKCGVFFKLVNLDILIKKTILSKKYN